MAASINLSDAVCKFFIGIASLSPQAREQAKREESQHSDVVLLNISDFDGGEAKFESATTMKVYEAFKWAVETYRFDFLVGQGDDAYFNLNWFLRITPDSRESLVSNTARLESQKLKIPLKHEVVPIHVP